MANSNIRTMFCVLTVDQVQPNTNQDVDDFPYFFANKSKIIPFHYTLRK